MISHFFTAPGTAIAVRSELQSQQRTQVAPANMI